MKTEHLRIDVLGGMDESWRAPPTSAELIENMTIDSQGVWSEQGGFESLYDPANLTGKDVDPFIDANVVEISSLHWFSRYGGGHQYTVWEQRQDGENDVDLVFFNGSTRSYDTIQAHRTWDATPGPKTQYLATAGRLYVTNGREQFFVWDGPHRPLSRVGFGGPPPAPEAQAISGNNEFGGPGLGIAGAEVGLPRFPVEGWRYGYAVTLINERGMESPRSDVFYASSTNPTANRKNPCKVLLPEIYETEVYGFRLYRTINLIEAGLRPLDGLPLYFHSEYVCGSGMCILDGKEDSDLGFEYDETKVGPTPSGCRLISLFKGCMFLSGSDAYPDRVFYSYPGFIEQFPAHNFFPLGDKDSGSITAMYPTKNALVVFKRRGIYLIKGDPASGFSSQTLTEDVGCTSARGVCEIPGIGLMFVTDSGLYVLRGALENTGTPTSVDPVFTRTMRRTWRRRVNVSALPNAVCAVYHRDREVWVAVPTGGASDPDLVFKYHYEWGAWSLIDFSGTGAKITSLTETADHRAMLLVGHTKADGQAQVSVYSKGYRTSVLGSGVATAKYQSAWLDFGSVWGRTEIRHLQPWVIQLGAEELSVSYRSDRAQSFSGVVESRSQDDSEQEALARWGSATWSEEQNWIQPSPVVVPVPVGSLALEWQYRIEAERIRLVSMDVEVAARAPSGDIRKLDTALNIGAR